MNRRAAVTGILDGAVRGDDVPALGPSEESFANKVLPTVHHSAAGLEPYTDIWGVDQILHLLRRTTFGVSSANLQTLRSMSMEQGVNTILAPPPPEASMPLTTDSREELAAVGDTWVYALYQKAGSTFSPTGIRNASLKSWWMELMLTQQLSIREKMVLFWHDHFVTERDVVNDPRFTWRYAALLRANALGNWKDLTRQVTTDGAMLRYLNGNTNTKTSRTRTCRELQELFTIGKGGGRTR
jgi:hypothetical protein